MILVDTSIWGRLADKSDPLHDKAKLALQKVIRNSMVPAVAAQSLYEFWVIATRPVANNGLGWQPVRAAGWMKKLPQTCRLIPEDPRILGVWERLVTSHSTSGKGAHDARLVAVMELHGIASILTFNVKDFVRYGVVVVDPQTF
jgi:predicted nucleic acid-binding protein